MLLHALDLLLTCL